MHAFVSDTVLCVFTIINVLEVLWQQNCLLWSLLKVFAFARLVVPSGTLVVCRLIYSAGVSSKCCRGFVTVSVTVTVSGWLQRTSTLWLFNKLLRVLRDLARIKEQYYYYYYLAHWYFIPRGVDIKKIGEMSGIVTLRTRKLKMSWPGILS